MNAWTLTSDELRVWAMFSKDDPGRSVYMGEDEAYRSCSYAPIQYRESPDRIAAGLLYERGLLAHSPTASGFVMTALGFVAGPPCAAKEPTP